MALDRKIAVRLALFVLAVVVAVGAFTRGVLQLGHRESGWYEVSPTLEGNAVLYASGVRMLYHVSGSGSANRLALNEVQKAYTDALLRFYKMLDAEKTYDDAVNLASISAAGGEPVAISEELYGVLSDALARTREGRGYSLFAGALRAEWETLLYLDEPQPFDPACSADEAERIAAAADMANRGGMFELALSDEGGYFAALTVSDAYRAFEAAYEIDAPALDLGALHDAYLVELTARELARRGYTAGYLYSDSGMVALLGGQAAYDCPLYGWADGRAVEAGAITVNAPAALCRMTAFSVTDASYGWYAVETEDGVRLRHRWYDGLTGECRDALRSVCLASGAAPLHELAYRMGTLCALDDAADIAAALNGGDMRAAWVLKDDDQSLHVSP